MKGEGKTKQQQKHTTTKQLGLTNGTGRVDLGHAVATDSAATGIRTSLFFPVKTTSSHGRAELMFFFDDWIVILLPCLCPFHTSSPEALSWSPCFVCPFSMSLHLNPLQWGAADAEIKVPSVENTELEGSPCKAWGRSVYSHACYAYFQGSLSCTVLNRLHIGHSYFTHSLRTQKLNSPTGENTELKRSPFRAWSRSVHSHTCYAYCRGFLPCLILPFLPFRCPRREAGNV